MAGRYGGMANGAQVGAYAEDVMREIMEQQEQERLNNERIGSMQRAATMAQHMTPDTLAGLFVGQLLGDAVGRWLNGGGGNWDGDKGEAGANSPLLADFKYGEQYGTPEQRAETDMANWQNGGKPFEQLFSPPKPTYSAQDISDFQNQDISKVKVAEPLLGSGIGGTPDYFQDNVSFLDRLKRQRYGGVY